jgi:hypothetical protein
MATAQTHIATCERCHHFMKEQPVGLAPQSADLSTLFYCVCTACGHTEYLTRPFESFWRRLAAA